MYTAACMEWEPAVLGQPLVPGLWEVLMCRA